MNKIEIVCHKGANEYAPENTYASTQLCIDWGMDYVEIDVNRSKDGVFYLLHGPTVDKTTNGHGNLVDLTSAEIDQLDAGSWFAPQFASERVPRLASFLAWVQGKSKLFIDVKAGSPQELIDLIYANGLENDCFFWCGKDEWALRLRELDKQLALKINVSNAHDVIDAHQRFQANIVEVSLENMNDVLIETAHNLGIKVMIYVQEKDPVAYQQVLDWGVDMINLNHGDLFAQIAQGK